MHRTDFYSGRDHVSLEKTTSHAMELAAKLAADNTSEEVRKKMEGLLGLYGSIAYEHGIRHGRRSRPPFRELREANAEGYERGWEDAMTARDRRQNWADDQAYDGEQDYDD